MKAAIAMEDEFPLIYRLITGTPVAEFEAKLSEWTLDDLAALRVQLKGMGKSIGDGIDERARERKAMARANLTLIEMARADAWIELATFIAFVDVKAARCEQRLIERQAKG